MDVGERIKKRRNEMKYSVDYVAEKLGKNRATIYRYESDEIENMSVDVITSLSKVLETSPAYLMGWTDSKEDLDTAHEYTYFDTYISAGMPDNIGSINESSVAKIRVPNAFMGRYAGNKDLFITRINGESMNKVIANGAIIVVKRVELNQLKDNDIVVYKYDNEYAVKRFLQDGDKVIFRPDSDDQTFTDSVIDIKNCNDLIIKGKVVLHVAEY